MGPIRSQKLVLLWWCVLSDAVARQYTPTHDLMQVPLCVRNILRNVHLLNALILAFK